MLVGSAKPPACGSYLEIRRGAHVIVARVVWSKLGRFGVQTQDLVPAGDLIRTPGEPPLPVKAGEAGFADRRASTRPPEMRHEASRRTARATEFGAFILIGALATMLIGETVSRAFAEPLAIAETALASD